MHRSVAAEHRDYIITALRRPYSEPAGIRGIYSDCGNQLGRRRAQYVRHAASDPHCRTATGTRIDDQSGAHGAESYVAQ
jgi:hypothetical protein